MPRIATVSWRTTVLCGPRSPRPRSVLFCLSERPTPLLTWVTLSLSAMTCVFRSGGAVRLVRIQIRHRLAAGLRDLLDRAQRLERHDRRVDHVVLVRRPDRLRQDVRDAGDLEHRADTAAGDHTGTGRGRTEQHLRGAEEALDVVRDRALHQRDLEEVALGAVGALADRLRHLVRLAETSADVAVLIADDDERREREPTAALDDLRDAVDVDDAVDQLADFFWIDDHGEPLERESRVTSAIGDFLDAAVIDEAVAIEHNAGDTGGLEALADGLA